MNIDHDFDANETSADAIADELYREFRDACQVAESSSFVGSVLAEARQTLPQELLNVREQTPTKRPLDRQPSRAIVLASILAAVAFGVVIWASIDSKPPRKMNAKVSATSNNEIIVSQPNDTTIPQEDFRQGAELISSGIGGTLVSLNFAREAADRFLQREKMLNVKLARRSSDRIEMPDDQDESLQASDSQVVAKITAKVLGLHSF